MVNKKKVNVVLVTSMAIVIGIVIWALALPEGFEAFSNILFSFLTGKFGWFYTMSTGIFLFFSVFIAFSKYGKIKLGDDDSKPEHGTVTWFAMLFSAGVAIGIIFWGVAEPLTHFVSPLVGKSGTTEAAQFAMEKVYLHWGLHPWAIYSAFALPLAYIQFRKKQPALVSRTFVPLIGEKRVNGSIGKIIDILSIFATVAGVCTSLGLGVMQINSGLHYLFGIPESKGVQVAIISVITLLFIMSALSGINKGIKILSNTNMMITCLIIVLSFIVGPSVKILNILTETLGKYFQDIVENTFILGAFKDTSWYSGWTIFYWAWWIAWAPCVGSFIARISKGRTIREFICGVLLVPSLLTFIWFAVFGTLGINLGLDVAGDAIKSTTTACFMVFSHYPLGKIISGLTILLVCTFFITSADSATFVLGMYSSNGSFNPSGKIKAIWGLLESGFAIALLVGSTNGLKTMQSISIAGAFPFIFVMLGAIVAMLKALKTEKVGSLLPVQHKVELKKDIKIKELETS